MVADFKFAIRQLCKAPGFTIVVVLSLALGIGASTTVMFWLRGLVLHPLPGVADEDRIAVLVSNQGGGCASLADLKDFGQCDGIFAGTVASLPTPAAITVGRQHEWIQAEVVSASCFDVLGVRPILGRTFLDGEDRKPGGNFVVVISERLWRRRFASDPAIVGKVIDLNRRSFTVVGVVPAEFRGFVGAANTEAWAPLSMVWEVRNQGTFLLTMRKARGWMDLVRLKPGVSLAQAQAAVSTVDARLAKAYPKESLGFHYRVVPISECPWGPQLVMGPALRLLLAVSLGVQLIVAANVGILLLARAAGRRKEIAIRRAAGARRWQLARLFLVESSLLALLGGGAAVLVAVWAVDAAPLLVPSAPQLGFALDGPSLGVAIALSIATSLFFGLLPLPNALRAELQPALKEGGRSSAGGDLQHRLRGLLVVAEVAVALVLLVGAGLCIKGLRQARRIDIGFSPDHVLVAGLRIGMSGYSEETGKAFYTRARQRVAALPGVENVALASWLPLGSVGCKGNFIDVDGYQRPTGEYGTYEYAIVSPGYFETLRIALVSGRDFTEADTSGAPNVAIVNEAFARRFWPGRDPIGRQFRTGGSALTVVGVARTGRYNSLSEGPSCFYYTPYLQGVPDLDLSLCVRSSGDPSAIAAPLYKAIHEIDPAVELTQTIPLAVYSGTVLAPQRLASSLLVVLGLVALVLAAMGVYSVLAYAVTQRMREIGVRIALGASARDILGLVVGHGLLLAAAGVAVGLGGSLAVTRLMSGFLYGVSPFDAQTLVGVSSLLGLIALLACYVPARRATKVDPIVALRSE